MEKNTLSLDTLCAALCGAMGVPAPKTAAQPCPQLAEYIEKSFVPYELYGKCLKIYVPFDGVSKASGHKRSNKIKLTEKYRLKNVKICGCANMMPYSVRCEIDLGKEKSICI